MNGNDFRIFYEKFAIFKLAEYLRILPQKIRHVSLENVISPIDLEYDGIKYDVKYSSPLFISDKKRIAIWDFNLRKRHNGKRIGQDHLYCDYFLCVGMQNGLPKKVFLIPAGDVPTNHVRISIKGKSKYHKFEI